jgi:hypothetical protein
VLKPSGVHTPRSGWRGAGRVGRLVLLSGLFWARPAGAQVLQGRVLDLDTSLPVAMASVVLMNESGEKVVTQIANLNGRFRLVAPEPGTYLVYAEGLGYLASIDGPLSLEASDTILVEYHLAPHPLQLDSISIEVESQSRMLDLMGFYDRRRVGLGKFVERKEIQERDPLRLADFLVTVPGVYVRDERVYLRGGLIAGGLLNQGPCPPKIYLDGVVVEGNDLDWISPDAVSALEVYRSTAEVPLQYGGPDASCGVILIWTLN